MELLNSFVILFVLLGMLLLLIHSSVLTNKSYPKVRNKYAAASFTYDKHLFKILQYAFISITQMPVLLLVFMIFYGFALSFYYWYQKVNINLTLISGLSIITTIISLTCVAIVLSPIIFITQKLLYDYEIESRIFRIAIYSVLIPFLYIFLINDLALGPLTESLMITGLILSYYQIFRGIFLCLQAPGVVFSHFDSRFTPILMIVSWLLVIIFNLYTMVLLVSNTDPYSFVDNTGPVTETLRLLYFTVITFTSVGYGDITPRGNFAVLISIIISVTGFLYSALFIGGILAAFTSKTSKG